MSKCTFVFERLTDKYTRWYCASRPRPPNENKNVKAKWTQKYGELLKCLMTVSIRAHYQFKV
jgi:plasmid rolling circle replication initiator protein Rep